MIPHPDHLLHQQQARAITRGSRQAADTAAMEAMFDALDSGVGREEAEKVFQNTYIKVLHGKERTTSVPIPFRV